ncbi:helix-turn-helix domain-containing protein [Ruminococcaceae bacterium OttesenSCG-928-I18]|nr:helix-turn-helix domain-containing protein [Ruminococcaceae bacterium OttesenSCG-928-I18]
MAIGERIHFLRNLRGMTQKFLGMAVGFPEKTADVRIAQYESGTRTPKADLTAALANKLDVSPKALDIPEIDSDIGLMHTLFALEDLRGLRVGEIDGELCLRLDKSNRKVYDDMLRMLSAWQEQAAKLDAGEITKEEYDQWRYRYPEFDTTQRWVKVPSQELSDYLVEALKDKK